MYRKYIKRLIDILFSGIGIILLIPFWMVISCAIYFDDPGPIIFKQKRFGKGKVFFYILKFRTMKSDAPHDVPTHMLDTPDSYITNVGKFLRRTSLDELPQLFNIFIGDMSIVGPRPALWNQDDLIMERDKYGANDIRPGLTGWAQINGRDELEVPVKAKLDGWYVQKMCFAFDLKCLFGTIGKVLKHDGIIEGKTEALGEKSTIEEMKEVLK